MGQLAEDLQERPLGVLPSNTVTDPLTELNVITSIDGLTLDGSFIPHSDFLVYQEKEQEPETIKEVVEIASSQSKRIENDAKTGIYGNVILNESDSMPKGVPSVKAPNNLNVDDNMPGMVLPSEPIVQSVDINTKSTSYAKAAGSSVKDQPKVNSNFRPLVVDLVFDGVNISIPRKVVEK
ncbi:hypothetical protein Tco_0236115, partial [Tanacetum coccineum]